MPCRDPFDDGGYQYANSMRKELDGLTDMLCRTCKDLERKGLDKHFPTELQAWWAAHKKWDAEREAAERALKEKEDLRKKGLAKLTEAERKALGLHP